MRISFVIPAYNEEQRLPQCLTSIMHEIARTPCDAEIVVVDNASTDHTATVARTFKGVHVVYEPHKGIVWARRAGLIASSGELVANIDADTMLPEGWLARVLAEFSKNDKLAALSGPFIYYDLSEFQRALARFFYVFGYLSYLVSHYVLHIGAMLQGGNFVVRRTSLEKAGGFDTSIEFYGEDTDIAKRISKVGNVKWTFRLPMYASGRRLAHEGALTTGLRYAKNYFSIIMRGKPSNVKYSDIREDS